MWVARTAGEIAKGERGRKRLTGVTQESGPPPFPKRRYLSIHPKHLWVLPPKKLLPWLASHTPPLTPPSPSFSLTEPKGPRKKKGKEGRKGVLPGSGVCSPQYGAASRPSPPSYENSAFGCGYSVRVGVGNRHLHDGCGWRERGVCCGPWRVSRGPGPATTAGDEHKFGNLGTGHVGSPQGGVGVVVFQPTNRARCLTLQNRCLSFICTKICRNIPQRLLPRTCMFASNACFHPLFFFLSFSPPLSRPSGPASLLYPVNNNSHPQPIWR